MNNSEMTIRAHDGGTFKAYVALPPGGTGPGMLLFHAIFGVNEVMRNYADAYAKQGYVVMCPDLFWRQEPGVSLSEQRPDDIPKGMALFNGYDMERGVQDLRTSLAAIREHEACTGRVVCVGYCFGGRMAYMMAAHTDVDAAVSYYGTAIERHLDVATKVSRPLMLHLAGNDQFVPVEAQQAIQAALRGNTRAVVHVYPGVGHAFARASSPHYDARSAELADQRTAAFLASNLAS
ncbi:MAG: dienelactone hydrolase family protein [Burkholderiaceae bacterium]|nr:dienelactone hydrolase family protein [Burkholderiaceae bacterium]